MPAEPAGQRLPPVTYALDFRLAAQHLVGVTARVPSHYAELAAGAWALRLKMPVWAPGSYMVREFARHVEGVRACDDAQTPLAVRRTAKDTWRVDLAGPPASGAAVTVHYQVYGRELTVRSNHIEADFALVQGAATYLSPPAAQAAVHQVAVQLPAAWGEALCGLPVRRDGAQAHIEAADFDVLVDSPWLLGNPELHTATVAGVPHTLATIGADAYFDGARAAQDLARIVAAARQVWGSLPYRRYTMMNLLLGGQGGLEHRHSAVIMASPWCQRSAATYRAFLGLMAHEQFHAWNIKTLRPYALGPFDYTQENVTPSLWVAEGLTAYYDNLLVRRAGLCDDAAYLGELVRDMASLEATPGRLVQSLAAASEDAWIKFYRRDENTDNTAVSYYLKGSLLGLLLDARIALATNGERCLDDVMRLALGRFGGDRGYTEPQFRALVSEVAPAMDAAWLDAAVDTTAPLDWAPLAHAYGLCVQRAVAAPTASAAGGSAEAPAPRLWLGCVVKDDAGRLLVTQVLRGSPAYAAGLQVDDELVAVGERRLNLASFGHWQLCAAPGDAACFLVARHQTLRRLSLTPAAALPRITGLVWDPDASAAQLAARARWLNGR